MQLRGSLMQNPRISRQRELSLKPSAGMAAPWGGSTRPVQLNRPALARRMALSIESLGRLELNQRCFQRACRSQPTRRETQETTCSVPRGGMDSSGEGPRRHRQEMATANRGEGRGEARHAAQLARGPMVTGDPGPERRRNTGSCMKDGGGEKAWAGQPGAKGKQPSFPRPLAGARGRSRWPC